MPKLSGPVSPGQSWGLVAFVSACAACAAPVTSERLDEVVSHPDAPPLPGFTECTVVTYRAPAESRAHVEPCAALTFEAHPPAGGDHYGAWAAFGTYDAPVPWGFLVHSLEHGAIVLAHDCADGCEEVLAEYADVAATRDDPVCRDEDGARFVITPDPDLDMPIAVVAWEHVYLATCLDPPSLRAFVDAHYGRAPEDLCVPGVDRSADGWCP